MNAPIEPDHYLDLSPLKCPLNFVKARLALEKLPPGAVLEIRVANDSESAANVPNSLRQEGHEIIRSEVVPVGEHRQLCLWVRRSSSSPSRP